MIKNILIITSGGSQLLTQLTVLKNEVTFENYEVIIIYNGVFRESLDIFFREVAVFYKYKFLGQINFDIHPSESRINNLLNDLILKRRFNFSNRIKSRFPALKKIKGIDLLIIPIRVKMFSDIVLLSFLKPKKILYTSDGVIDELPERNFSKLKFPYLRNYLKVLPVNSYVFSPDYLNKEANKIGIYKEADSCKILNQLSTLSMVSTFREKYLLNQIEYIIFSQHFSLSEDVSFENEIEFYKRVIKEICHLEKKATILFKPHPRDTSDKIEEIKKLKIDKLVIIEEFFQAVPIEFFIDEFINMNSIFITGNSSAPLCFQKTDRIISVSSSELLSEKLNSKIKEFAIFNELKLIEV